MFVPRTLHLAFSALLLAVPTVAAHAEPIAVLRAQGATRGFLVLRSESGATLGYGEVTQVAHGDRVTSRMTFHFRDGSLDDETATFTQRGVFQLLSDHHIQRGPFFAKPIDMLVLANGTITNRSVDKDGTQKIETSHIDLPPDTANGMIAALLINLRPDVTAFKLPLVAASGKGRLIQLAVTPDGTASFSCVAGVRRKATILRIKPELGGLTGIVAPMIGKQPADIFVWVLQGEVPAIVREVGQLSEGGPIVSIELAGTAFPRDQNGVEQARATPPPR